MVLVAVGETFGEEKGGAMVSDEEIVSGLETLLRQADFAVTTSGDIRQQLEHKLGIDLSHKRAFIRDHIDLFVQSKGIPTFHHPPPHPHPHQPQPQFHLHHAAHPHGHAHVAAVNILPFPPHCSGLADMPTFDAKPNFGCPVKVDIPQGSVVQELPKDISHVQVQSNTPAGGKRRGGPGGLNKLCGVSPELQAIVGEPAMTRTQIVKELWAYIRKNNLQDPSNKRKIICNDALQLVFETDCTDMFKMNKLLAKHILPLEPAKDSGPEPKRLKASYLESPAQGAGSGSPPVIISDALSKFFGTGEREMPQSEALERIWNYIQMNHLQDPLNSVITCDYRLCELFNCEKFPALGLSEMLSCHFLKR